MKVIATIIKSSCYESGVIMKEIAYLSGIITNLLQ